MDNQLESKQRVFLLDEENVWILVLTKVKYSWILQSITSECIRKYSSPHHNIANNLYNGEYQLPTPTTTTNFNDFRDHRHI